MNRLVAAILGFITGGLAGYIFYDMQYGQPGTCTIPGSPWTNLYFLTIGGAFFGAILVEGIGDMFRRRRY